MPSINGIAHIQLTVSDMGRAVPFYERLLHSLEMVTLIKRPDYFYCIGGRTGVAIAPVSVDGAKHGFSQDRPGLHHLCFRAKSAAKSAKGSASRPTSCRARATWPTPARPENPRVDARERSLQTA